jgi:hypothetical protein
MQKRHWFRYWLGLAAAAGVTALYAYERDISGQYDNYRRSQAEFRDMQRQVEELRAKEELARRRVEMLRTDPVEMEATIRRNKNLLRAGERIYRVEAEPDQGASSSQEQPVVRSEMIGQNEAPASSGRD